MDKHGNEEQSTHDFRLSLVDDHTHRHIWSVKFTRFSFILTVITVVLIGIIAVFCAVAYTPLKTFVPGYPDSDYKHLALQNAMKADSLENTMVLWELYSENLRRVIDGEEPVGLDSLVRLASSSRSEGLTVEMARSDSLLRQSVSEEEKFNVSGSVRNLPIDGRHFFPPVKGGVISQAYDKLIHPYADITAPTNSMVMSVLDGTVIYSGWDEEAGYTIQVQHSGGIVSIYKHNQQLLKKVGEKVSAGTPIALLGNTGTLTTGDHLHFELWYNGEAVDPSRYINFN